FDSRIHVLCVFTENDHIELVRMLHRRGHAGVITHGTNTCVKVHDLPQSDVERTNAAADGRSERAFDGNMKITRGINRALRQPVFELRKSLLSGKDFIPMNLALAAVSFFYCAIKYAN